MRALQRRTVGVFLFFRPLGRIADGQSRLALLFEGLDFDVDTRRQIEAHQRIHRLLGRLQNVNQPLVGANFERFRDFLSTCGDRKTQYLFFTVGNGIGPATCAPVRLAVSTISPVEVSSTR